MQRATSVDGTPIAFEQVGTGDAVLVVGGAFSTADAGRPLAAALAAAGLRGVVVDRRGRGSSGDTRPYSPVREAEDLAAVAAAVGGATAVLGHSSGAVLALLAASLGTPLGRVFLSEPPFTTGDHDPAPDLPDRLQDLVDAGRPEDAVTLFQREGVGLPEAVVAGIRRSPVFGSLVALAQTTVYDARLVRDCSPPTAAMLAVRGVTVLRGEPTFPVLVTAADRLVAAMDDARLVVVPESRDHGVDPVGTAREVLARLS